MTALVLPYCRVEQGKSRREEGDIDDDGKKVPDDAAKSDEHPGAALKNPAEGPQVGTVPPEPAGKSDGQTGRIDETDRSHGDVHGANVESHSSPSELAHREVVPDHRTRYRTVYQIRRLKSEERNDRAEPFRSTCAYDLGPLDRFRTDDPCIGRPELYRKFASVKYHTHRGKPDGFKMLGPGMLYLSGRPREVEREGGAFTDLAFHLNHASVILNEPLHDGEAEPYPFG